MSISKWMDKEVVVHIHIYYTVICVSAIKINVFESVKMLSFLQFPSFSCHCSSSIACFIPLLYLFQSLYHINCSYLKFLLKVPTSGWLFNLFLQHFVFLVSCLFFHSVYHVFCCYCCCCYYFCYWNFSLGEWGGTSGKEPTCQCRRRKRHGFDPWVGKIP